MLLSNNEIIGKIINLTIPVCRINVGWNESQGINFVYAPPEGWHILEFKDIPISKKQKASYGFDLVPSNFSFSSETIVEEKFQELHDLMVNLGKDKEYSTKLNQAKDDFEKYTKSINSTHSAINVIGNVKGDNNFLKRYPGRLYLDLLVKIIYLPNNEAQFLKSIEALKNMIENDSY